MQIKIGKKSYKPSEIRKAIEAGIGVTIILANSALTEFANYLPGKASFAITTIVGIVTAARVFLKKNADIIDASDNFE